MCLLALCLLSCLLFFLFACFFILTRLISSSFFTVQHFFSFVLFFCLLPWSLLSAFHLVLLSVSRSSFSSFYHLSALLFSFLSFCFSLIFCHSPFISSFCLFLFLLSFSFLSFVSFLYLLSPLHSFALFLQSPPFVSCFFTFIPFTLCLLSPPLLRWAKQRWSRSPRQNFVSVSLSEETLSHGYAVDYNGIYFIYTCDKIM